MMQIHAVVLPPGQEPPMAWFANLSPAEAARAADFHDPDDRYAFVAAHALLRMTLAAILPNSPHPLPILTDKYGKPYLQGHPAHFSLTHTRGLAAIALASTPIGIDAESCPPTLRRSDIDAILTEPERKQVAEAPNWQRAFLRLWTAKEAVAKAEGWGLALAPDRIAVGARTATSPTRTWQIRQTDFGCNHVLSLAHDGGLEPSLHLHDGASPSTLA